MNGKILFAAIGLALASLALGVPASVAQDRDAEFSHAGGFVCGQLEATRTHFNIRNGNSRAVTVDLELALTFPAADPAPNGASFTPRATTSLQSVRLRPGEAVMIDCDEILTAALGLDADPPPYFLGILDARSKRPLQVTRTQTAGANGEDISSLLVTEIKSREVGGDDDD